MGLLSRLGASSENKYARKVAVDPAEASEGRGKTTGSQDNASASASGTNAEEFTPEEIEAQYQMWNQLRNQNQSQSNSQSQSSKSSKSRNRVAKHEMMKTKAAYTAEDDKQLTVGKGVTVEALEVSSNGQWCWCRHHGIEGWLPRSYLGAADELDRQKHGADECTRPQDEESALLPEQWTSKLSGTMVLHTVQNTVKLAQYLVQLLTRGYGTVSSLHIACWEGSVDAVAALAGTEQAVRMWHSRKGELTPLHIASICGHYKVVDFLISNLPSDAVNLATVNLICPLHIGAVSSSEITEVLIGARADPAATTLDKDTPLHFACCYLQAPAIKILLDSGADAAAANAFGVTPLHIAVAYAALEKCSLKEAQVVLLLCAKGANPAVPDGHGRTPASIARMAHGRNELTEFLEKCSTAAEAQAEAQRILDESKSDKKKESYKQTKSRSRDSARRDPFSNADDSSEEGDLTDILVPLQKTPSETNKKGAGASKGRKEAERPSSAPRALRDDPLSYSDDSSEEGDLADILSKSPSESNKKGAGATKARKEQSEIMRLADDYAKLSEVLSQTKKELEDSKSSQALLQELLENSRRMAEQMQGMSESSSTQNKEVMEIFKNDMDKERSDFKKQLEAAENAKSKLVEELASKQKQLDDFQETYVSDLTKAYMDAEEKAKEEGGNAASQEAAAKAQGVIDAISAELEDVQKTLQKEREDAKAVQVDRDEAQKKVSDLKQQLAQVKVGGQQSETVLKQKVMQVEGELQEQQIRCRNLQEDLAAAKELLEQVETFRQRADHAEQMLEPFKRRVSEVQEQFEAEQAIRKKYHNQLQDLKGAIRVYARVRPLVQRERDLKDAEVLKKTDGFSLELGNRYVVSNGQSTASKEAKTFTFDSIFDANNTQEDVYAECKDLVISCCDGFNVTIFAYGQTGAGKTHTMYGSAEQPGLVPRITNDMFKVVERLSKEKDVSVKCTMCELYKDDLVDLLFMGGNKDKARPNLVIRPDARGTVYVENITERAASCAEDLRRAMADAQQRRHVAATMMNADSSRSHLIFTVIVESTHKQSKQVAVGKLTLIDLAGSERLKKSGATGDQMKEAQSINKSLTALGDVIEALTKNSKHIPYRNHKLTQLLADSLGGNAKTLMFVNCSPAGSNADESNSSLTYAARAKLIVNKVQKNQDSQEVARLKKVITTMSREMDGLRGGAGQMDLPPEF